MQRNNLNTRLRFIKQYDYYRYTSSENQSPRLNAGRDRPVTRRLFRHHCLYVMQFNFVSETIIRPRLMRIAISNLLFAAISKSRVHSTRFQQTFNQN
jgi:hypothetical protein